MRRLFVLLALSCNALTGIDDYKLPGTTGDGGSDGPRDAGGARESGIWCESAGYCDPAGENCCRLGGPPPACVATATPCGGNSQTLECDDTADCAAKGKTGTVCCCPVSMGGNAQSCTCTPLASCPAMRIVLCDTKVAGECAAVGGSCLPSVVKNMTPYNDCH